MKRKIWHTDNIIRGRLIEIGRRVPYAEIQMPTAKIGKMRAERFIENALNKIQNDYYRQLDNGGGSAGSPTAHCEGI
ncbi:MAG: hypothetical protein K0U39_08295 [Alphaproteobacteria bacterium]|nr:hypothetical protein [Alphaproteobacteria bacterium]